MDAITQKLAYVSTNPGVYLMHGADNEVLYVGKAKNLKNRLSAYFNLSNGEKANLALKTQALVRKIRTFDTIETNSEKEALLLESNLIKRYKPRYNVILKDDKRYPSLRIDMRVPYPTVTITRKIKNDGAVYFGPFASANAVRQTLKFINKTFKLRKCKTNHYKKRSRPCLNYQIGACLGLCCHPVTEEAYRKILMEVRLFLKGRTPALIRKVKSQMLRASAKQDYETATLFRDKLLALEKTLEKQVAVTTDFMDRDTFAIATQEGHALITLLMVRGGVLMGSQHYPFSETMATPQEMIMTFIRQYYDKLNFVPKEILLPFPAEDALLLSDWLTELKGQKVRLLHPQRGEKAHLLSMAEQNAHKELKDYLDSKEEKRSLLSRLQKILHMEKPPYKIECFDNSNIGGQRPVSAKVVFQDGKPDKSRYRKYTIRTVTQADDYATMAEVLKRRFAKEAAKDPLPDLLIVDGGRGQLNIAIAVIESLHLNSLPYIIGIAKKNEQKGETQDKIFLPGRSNPVQFGQQTDLLLFLQRIRDESHRFAISFHRQKRTKAAIESVFDQIAGIGPTRRKALLRHFGSYKKLKAASEEEIGQVSGISSTLASVVYASLHEEE